MTRPHEGEAFIGVHADTSPYEREVDRGIRADSKHLEETTLKDTGHEFGKALNKGMGDELERSGPELVKRVEKGLEGKRVRWKVKTVVDKDNNVVRTVVEETFQDIERAFNNANKPGGPLDKVGKGFSDAIGNAFNVSGSSPLIGLLFPAIGAIVALVTAAVQAVNALVAVLGTVPAVLAAIGLQVGVLFLAFKGLGNAIGGAFQAKNAKELEAAIKDLAPAAQAFVRQLLPLRDLFHALAQIAQQNFFKALGDVIPRIQTALGPTFIQGFSQLATSLGDLFRGLALFFASPEFVFFVQTMFPATLQFLQQFGPAFLELFKGVTEFSTQISPFLQFLGGKFSDAIFEFGAFLARVSRDPAFQKWLGSMEQTVLDLGKFFDSVIQLVGTLLSQLDKAGGSSLIAELAHDLDVFTDFLASPIGQKALEGLIDLAIILTKTFVGLVMVILGLLALLEVIGEWVKNTGGPAIIHFFDAMAKGFEIMVEAVGHFFQRIWHDITDNLDQAAAAVRSFPSRILAAVAGFGTLLFDAGRNLIQGLIDGMLSRLGPVRNAIGFIAQTIRDHWPFSPAKVGPLSGSGDPMIAGQKTIERFAEGMKLEIPELKSVSSEMVSNIVFGPGAIRIDFNGQLPSQQQAEQTGRAVGAGINQQLAARDTRLAVRTL